MKTIKVLLKIVLTCIIVFVMISLLVLSIVFPPFLYIFLIICLATEFFLLVKYSHKRRLMALIALIEMGLCCISAYYHGSVRGQEEWFTSDFAYLSYMGDYNVYRLCTYLGDCAILIMVVWGITFLLYKTFMAPKQQNAPQSDEPAQQESLAKEKEEETETTNELAGEEVELKLLTEEKKEEAETTSEQAGEEVELKLLAEVKKEETETTNELAGEEVELKKECNMEWKSFRKRKKLKIGLLILGTLLLVNLLWPTSIQPPVEGCGKESYNPKSFWHPWGDHEHRGIDIFAKKGTPVHPAIGGIVIKAGYSSGLGGNCVVIFSSGMRFHYYAHLDEVKTHFGAIVSQKSIIGTVGNTGNAAGKPPHLHYSISSFIPQGDWRFYSKWMIFFINPIKELEN